MYDEVEYLNFMLNDDTVSEGDKFMYEEQLADYKWQIADLED